MSTVTERARRADALRQGRESTEWRCWRIAELEDIVVEALRHCECSGDCEHRRDDRRRCDLAERVRLLGLEV